MYTALGVFLRAMLLSQMYVNDDFMHPCFHHRFTSESSIHTEQTLKFSLWATSVCVSFVCFLDEVGHAKLNKCTGSLSKIKQQRHQVTGNIRLYSVPQTAGVLSCDHKRGSLSVIHSNHWTLPPANTAEGRFLRVSIITICSNMSLAQPNRRWCQK